MRLGMLLPFALASSMLAACSSCSHKSAGENVAIVEAPVPAPASLLGELAIENPDAFWSRVQRGVGGFVALLPMSLGGLVSSFASIDPAIGPIIDGASPSYAAAVARGPSEIGWAVAVRFTDLAHARSTLLDGPNAKYNATEDGDFTLLAFKGGTAVAGAPQAAISKTGYLVLGASKADVDEIGPYLVRTMPTRPRATTDVALDLPHAALRGPIHDRLAAAWASFKTEKETQAQEAQKNHGRPADFGDPIGILALSDSIVQKRLAVASDLDTAHLTLEATGATFTLDATLTPSEDNGAASQWIGGMQNGDIAPLLDAPAGVATILTRASASDRASAPDDVAAALKQSLGDHFRDEDANLARAAVADWESASGSFVVTSALTSPVPALLVRTPTDHPDVATRAAHKGCELLQTPSFHGILSELMKVDSGTFGTADVVGVGHAVTFAFKRRVGPGASAAWLTSGGNFVFAEGVDGAASLGATLHAKPTWRDDGDLAAHALAAGPNVSFAVAAKPFSSDPGASLLLVSGRDSDHLHASVFSSDVVLREAIRLLGR
ncbi:MAG: hypothetical protein ACRELY_03020 [Polyangiaceae bacterium]